MRRLLSLLVLLSTAFPMLAAEPEQQLKVVLKLDSAQLPADSTDLLPRTIWRRGPNKARIEGTISETGHRMLVVADSPNLWVADLDTRTGFHTVDQGTVIGASVPIFPGIDGLEVGGELEFFKTSNAKRTGTQKISGRTCEKLELGDAESRLTGCFEPGTSRPVTIELQIPGGRYSFSYLDYKLGEEIPTTMFNKPEGITFTDRPHSDTTNAAQ